MTAGDLASCRIVGVIDRRYSEVGGIVLLLSSAMEPVCEGGDSDGDHGGHAVNNGAIDPRCVPHHVRILEHHQGAGPGDDGSADV